MAASQIQRADIEDLWKTALLSLSEDDRSKIDFQNFNKLEILSELHSWTSQEIKRAEKGRLTYRRKSGETVIIRDLFAKVAKWIDHFKAIGDVAIQYDPGHAALPWAGVRFLLQIAVSDLNTTENILEHATVLAEIVCRYKFFEALFWGSTSAAALELRRALVTLYTKILIYLVHAKAYFSKGTLSRSVKNALLTNPNLDSCFRDIQSAQNDIDTCAIMTNIESQLESHLELKGILKSMKTPLARSASMIEVIKDELDVSKRSEILRWISTEPYENHHRQTQSDVLAGTGQWLLNDSTYLKWKNDSASSILWLHGIPGSGKTKLVSHVIADAVEDHEKGLCPLPVYFYCSRNPAEPGRSNPRDIIASLLRQLARINSEGSILEPVTRAYQEQVDRGFPQKYWELDQCRDLVMQLLPYYPTITIILDALDECDPEERDSLLETLETILQNSSTLVRIFVSSRDDQDIVCTLEGYPNLVLSSDRNSGDIEEFVSYETDRLIRKRSLLRFSTNKDELRSLIIEKINKGAEGMFRWASLQLQILCGLKTDQDVRDRVGKLPPTLENLYRELLDKMEQQENPAARQYTRNVFSWLLSAQETLNTEQFIVAISKGIGLNSDLLTTDHILDLCCNFVVLDPTLDTFRFAHLSVREFLEKQDAFQPEPINFLAAEICLLSLIGSNDTNLTWDFLTNWGYGSEDLVSFQEIYQYSCLYWAPHSQRAGSRRMDENFQKLLLYFTTNESNKTSSFYRWEQEVLKLSSAGSGEALREMQRCVGESPSAVLAACRFDIVEILQARMNTGQLQDYKIRNIAGQTHVALVLEYASPTCIEILHSVQHVRLTANTFMNALGNEMYGKELVALHLKHNVEVQIDESLIEQLAISRNGLDTLKLLVSYPGSRFQAMGDVLRGAMSHQGIKSGIFDFLRTYIGDDFRLLITEDTIEAAILRLDHSSKVVSVLLEHADPDVYDIETLISIAVDWSFGGTELLLLLLEKQAKKQISEQTMIWLCGVRNNVQIMKTLLKDSRYKIPVTQRVIEAVARSKEQSMDLSNLLWDHYEGPFQITEDWLKVVAKTTTEQEKVMAFFIEKHGGKVQITEDVLMAATKNYSSGLAVIALLLDHEETLDNVTRDVVMAATRNFDGGEDVMEVLWNSQTDQEDMAEELLVMAASNQRKGNAYLMILLRERVDHMHATENVLIAAAENRVNGTLFMKFLLDLSNPQISVTEEVLVAVARNTARGYEMMKLLIDNDHQDFVSEEILIAAAGNYRMMSLLLNVFAGDIVITMSILNAACCRSPDRFQCLRVLLDRCGHRFEIIEETLELAAQGGCGRAVLSVLLDHQKDSLQHPQKILMAIMRSVSYHRQDMMEMFLERYKEEVQATDDILMAAVKNSDSRALKLLLGHFEDSIDVNEKLMRTAARYGTRKTLELLVGCRGGTAQPDHDMLMAAASNGDDGAQVMKFILEGRNGTVSVTSDIIEAAAKNYRLGHKILQLLQRHDSKQFARCITNRAAFLAACNGWTDRLELFKDLGFNVTDENLSIARFYKAVERGDQAVVQDLISKGTYPDHPDEYGRTPLSIATETGNAKVVMILLRSGNVDVNSQNIAGRQPIHYAAIKGNPCILRCLLQAGSTVDTADLSGKTPEDWAKQCDQLGMYRCMKGLYAS